MTGGRDADLLCGVWLEDGGGDHLGPFGPPKLRYVTEVFAFGVLMVVLAGIGDELSSNEDVAAI